MFHMETWTSGNRCASLVTYKKWYMVTSNMVQQRPTLPICFTSLCCTQHLCCKDPAFCSLYFEMVKLKERFIYSWLQHIWNQRFSVKHSVITIIIHQVDILSFQNSCSAPGNICDVYIFCFKKSFYFLHHSYSSNVLISPQIFQYFIYSTIYIQLDLTKCWLSDRTK